MQFKGTPHEVATQVLCETRMGVERAIRYAFEVCRKRNRKKRLTLVGKTNVLTFAHGLWYRTFMEIGEEYPEIEKDYNHVDACCMWFVKNPEYYDTIVTDNMFGDIITDLGAMIQGGMGVAAGGNINPQGVSMYRADRRFSAQVHRHERASTRSPRSVLWRCSCARRATIAAMRSWIEAGERVELAVMATTPKMKSQAAGKMGFSTTEVGDLVAKELDRVGAGIWQLKSRLGEPIDGQ